MTVSSDQHDLDTIELVIEEAATETAVATRTCENIDRQSFTRDGTGNDPGIVLYPVDSGYDVGKKTTYRQTVTAYATHSNFDQETSTT